MPDVRFHDTISTLLVNARRGVWLRLADPGHIFGFTVEEITRLVGYVHPRCLLPFGAAASATRYVHVRALLAAMRDGGWDVRFASPFEFEQTELIIDSVWAIIRDRDAESPARVVDALIAQSLQETLARDFSEAVDVPATEVIYQVHVRDDDTWKNIVTVTEDVWATVISTFARQPNLMYELGPRKFEELVAELLNRDGAEVTLTPPSRDGGRDIFAWLDTPLGKALYLIECKRYGPANPVGVEIVRSVYGVVAEERATAGLIVTTSSFTKGAIAFRERVPNQLSLRAYSDLAGWLRRHSPTWSAA